jgi:hypothetical protein
MTASDHEDRYRRWFVETLSRAGATEREIVTAVEQTFGPAPRSVRPPRRTPLAVVGWFRRAVVPDLNR